MRAEGGLPRALGGGLTASTHGRWELSRDLSAPCDVIAERSRVIDRTRDIDKCIKQGIPGTGAGLGSLHWLLLVYKHVALGNSLSLPL